MVEIFLDASKAVLFLISNPLFAESEVDIAATRGIANPRACGHVITITVAILSIEKLNDAPIDNQINNVENPTVKAIIVSQKAALSASL